SAEQTRFEGMLIQAWDALGDRAEVAWAEGRAMTLEQAVLYAFQEDHESRL
ncbi:MAG: hypothetical protein AVDCRST_MAG93-2418, partial [uncultured Chloroflexia bacterium]